jgi:ABC-2 type transport system ATP-binding protein
MQTNRQTEATALLDVRGLSKRYGRTTAVDNLSFQVRAGEIVGLVGPNGAGKTTVLRCCVGILRPSAGRILVDGLDLAASDDAARRQMAFVPELPNLYSLLTVAEQIEFIARCYGPLDAGFAGQRDALLHWFDLWPHRNKLSEQLSKGMRQKTAMAAAFLHHARVLLFDEPLIGVDPLGIRRFKELLLEAREQGAAILISTHLLDTAERLCDRMLVLQGGRKRAEGTLDELRAIVAGHADATLEEVFLQLTNDDNGVTG